MASAERPMMPVTAGGDVRCLRFKSSSAEIDYLADYLAERLKELPDAPKPKERIVCLFPSRKILSAYYDKLSLRVRCEQRSAPVSDARRSAQRLCELLARPTQRFQQRLVLNDFPDLKPKHRKLIVQRIRERDTSPQHAVETLVSDGTLTGQARASANVFLAVVAATEQKDLSLLANRIALRVQADVGLVRAQLEEIACSQSGSVSETIEKALDVLLPETATPPENGKSVQFLTMHSSKGLTRRVVVLPGLEEACIPGEAEGESKEEKERLFFVALSRATDYLLLTFPHHRGGGDPLAFNMEGRGKASPFLERAGLRAKYHAS